jgi:hypothetical protein
MLVHVLLESPLKLVIVELAAALILIAVYRRLASPPRWLLPAAAVAAVALLVVQRAVETDAEHIRRVVREMGRAVDDGDADALRAHLADEFAAWGRAKDDFVDFVYQQLEYYRVDEVRTGGFDLHRRGDAATVEFTARARVSSPELPVYPYVSRWRLEMVRRGEDWLVTRVEELGGPGGASRAVGGRPARGGR